MCGLGLLGFELGFNLGFSKVLNDIFEGFSEGLGFRFEMGFGLGFGLDFRIVLPRFSRVFGWFSRLKKGWVFLGFLCSFRVRILRGF